MRSTMLRALGALALAALALTFATGIGSHGASVARAQTVAGVDGMTMASASSSGTGSCLDSDSWCNYCVSHATAALCTEYAPVLASGGSGQAVASSGASGSASASNPLPAYGMPIQLPSAPVGAAWIYCTTFGNGPMWTTSAALAGSLC